MKKLPVDLIGEVHLLKNGGRTSPIAKEYWGHGNIKGKTEQNSYVIYLIELDLLQNGKSCKAEFRFKFIDDENFNIKIEEGNVIELCEAGRKIGEFKVQEVLNEKLKRSHNNS